MYSFNNNKINKSPQSYYVNEKENAIINFSGTSVINSPLSTTFLVNMTSIYLSKHQPIQKRLSMLIFTWKREIPLAFRCSRSHRLLSFIMGRQPTKEFLWGCTEKEVLLLAFFVFLSRRYFA